MADFSAEDSSRLGGKHRLDDVSDLRIFILSLSNFRLKDGTWVAPLPPKRGYDEVSSLDYGIGGDDANFVRSRKRQRRQALDDIEEDSEEEGFFRRASSLKQSEPVGIRQMLGMAKRDASFS